MHFANFTDMPEYHNIFMALKTLDKLVSVVLKWGFEIRVDNW
jgi:hypothetical protein